MALIAAVRVRRKAIDAVIQPTFTRDIVIDPEHVGRAAVAHGLSEYLDQIVDGEPVGIDDLVREKQVVAEPGVSAEPDLELRDSHTRARQAALRSLSPSDYPNVIACAEPLTFCANGDAYFGQGIDLLVAGVLGVS